MCVMACAALVIESSPATAGPMANMPACQRSEGPFEVSVTCRLDGVSARAVSARAAGTNAYEHARDLAKLCVWRKSAMALAEEADYDGAMRYAQQATASLLTPDRRCPGDHWGKYLMDAALLREVDPKGATDLALIGLGHAIEACDYGYTFVGLREIQSGRLPCW